MNSQYHIENLNLTKKEKEVLSSNNFQKQKKKQKKQQNKTKNKLLESEKRKILLLTISASINCIFLQFTNKLMLIKADVFQQYHTPGVR